MKCAAKTEIFSRVCGYHRPVRNWNKGKRAEFAERQTFDNLSSTPHASRSSHNFHSQDPMQCVTSNTNALT